MSLSPERDGLGLAGVEGEELHGVGGGESARGLEDGGGGEDGGEDLNTQTCGLLAEGGGEVFVGDEGGDGERGEAVGGDESAFGQMERLGVVAGP